MIRPAAHNDLPRVWEMIQELATFENLPVSGTLERLQADLGKSYDCYVFESDGEIVAYALTFITYSTFRTQPGMWLEDLYVSPDRRGSGIGKQMLSYLMNESRRRGYGRLEWSVLDWNQSAIEFYQRMGATILPDWQICRITFGP